MFYSNCLTHLLDRFKKSSSHSLSTKWIWVVRCSQVCTIASTLIFSQTVLAESFGEYCVSKAKQTDVKQQVALLQKSPEVSFSRNGVTYRVIVDESIQRQLLLEQEGKSSAIDQMTLAPEGGYINHLVMGQDNWLWIDRNVIDYLMLIKFQNQKAYFDSPIQLPELSSKPCHLIRRLLKRCEKGEYNYSPSLNRVFVSGYPKQMWGKKKYTHLEYVSGQERPVPELLEKAVFIADVPEWHGAIFRDHSGEALFYDGVDVVNISQAFLGLAEGEKFQDWDVQKTLSGRTFLGKFIERSSNDPLLLMELKAKPGLTPVYLPEDFPDRWLEVFTMPNDPKSKLWIMTRSKIGAEIDHKIQTTVKLSSSSTIKRPTLDHPLATEQSGGSTVSFTVKKNSSKSIINYFLRRSSPGVDCGQILDFGKPITLKEEV